MPAAAVIPAPIAYIKVVAVKKLVVGSQSRPFDPPQAVFVGAGIQLVVSAGLYWLVGLSGNFTLKKLECSKQAKRLNNGAWNNGIGPRFYFVGFRNPRGNDQKGQTGAFVLRR